MNFSLVSKIIRWVLSAYCGSAHSVSNSDLWAILNVNDPLPFTQSSAVRSQDNKTPPALGLADVGYRPIGAIHGIDSILYINVTCSFHIQAAHQKPQDNITTEWRDVSHESFQLQPFNMFRVGGALFPPPEAQLRQFFRDGVEDAKAFLSRFQLYEHGTNPRQEGPLVQVWRIEGIMYSVLQF